MAESKRSEQHLYSTEHGTLTEDTTPATEHKHGTMDITEQKRTFEGFIKFWVYLGIVIVAILIFLALFAA